MYMHTYYLVSEDRAVSIWSELKQERVQARSPHKRLALSLISIDTINPVGGRGRPFIVTYETMAKGRIQKRCEDNKANGT